MNNCVRGVACSLLLFSLVGCGLFKPPVVNIPPPPKPPDPPKPTIIKGKIDVSPSVNPDGKGRPSPVVFRFYELKTLDGFSKADFDKLYQDDATALAADLQLREEKVVRPGEQIVIAPREVQKDTHFLAAFAAYRDLDRSNWRATFPVPLNMTTPIVVKVGELAVTISEDKP